MSEIKEGNILIGVPERTEEKFKREENCLCCECKIKETIIYRTEEKYSLNSVTRKIQPLVKIKKDKDDVYHIKLFKEGEGLEATTEYSAIYYLFSDPLTGLPRIG